MVATFMVALLLSFAAGWSARAAWPEVRDWVVMRVVERVMRDGGVEP